MSLTHMRAYICYIYSLLCICVCRIAKPKNYFQSSKQAKPAKLQILKIFYLFQEDTLDAIALLAQILIQAHTHTYQRTNGLL